MKQKQAEYNVNVAGVRASNMELLRILTMSSVLLHHFLWCVVAQISPTIKIFSDRTVKFISIHKHLSIRYIHIKKTLLLTVKGIIYYPHLVIC